jgi:DNA-binding transcriptional regulator YhcF (GntR family)
MQLWFSRKSPVTLREQLVTQIILAILSDDLRPGQRLPSTRELARRFHLHPNTISSGYRQLQREHWLEFRKGSGVYVAESKPQGAQSPEHALDLLVTDLISSARLLGISMSAIRSRLRHWFELQPPDHFLLVEPDEELRRILTVEIAQAVALPVKSASPREAQHPEDRGGAMIVRLAHKEKPARAASPEAANEITLQVRSVPASLANWLPAPPGILIGVASSWPGFLKMARTMLVAAGLDPDTLIFRDARKSNWQRGLKETAAVVCDVATAAQLPSKPYVLQFPLIAEASLAELKRCEQFLRNPLELPR